MEPSNRGSGLNRHNASRYGHGDVWRIAGPLILSNISVPLLGAADTAVLGHLDDPRFLGGLAVGATIFGFLYMALNFLRMGTTGLVGRAAGDPDRLRYRRAVKLSLQWSACVALLFAAIYWIAGPAIIALLTSIETVRITAADCLPWMIASPLLSVWSFAFDGIFVGATRAREMRNTMLLSLGLFAAAWWLPQPLGNHGLWLAFMVFMSARGVSL